MKKSSFQKIEDVLREANKPLAVHEFQNIFISMPVDHLDGGRIVDGRFYVGCSEATLARQLRKMRELRLVNVSIREGKAFAEYRLSARPAIQQDFSFLKV